MSRYQCNCGQVFQEPEERTIHMAQCDCTKKRWTLAKAAWAPEGRLVAYTFEMAVPFQEQIFVMPVSEHDVEIAVLRNELALERGLQEFGMFRERAIRDVILEWKHFWMSQADYSERAFGIDANMTWDLARRLEKLATKGKDE